MGMCMVTRMDGMDLHAQLLVFSHAGKVCASLTLSICAGLVSVCVTSLHTTKSVHTTKCAYLSSAFR